MFCFAIVIGPLYMHSQVNEERMIESVLLCVNDKYSTFSQIFLAILSMSSSNCSKYTFIFSGSCTSSNIENSSFSADSPVKVIFALLMKHGMIA